MSLYTDTILPPPQGRDTPRWLIAALIVLALHVGIGAYLVLTRHIGMPPGQPPDALMINLAPVNASPPPQPEQEEEKPQLQPVERVPEEPAVVSTPLPPPPPIPTILETPVLPPPQPKPVPQKQEEPKKEVQKKEIQKPQKKAEKEKHRQEHSTQARELARHATAPAPGFSGQSMASWESEVLARINAAKRYPEEARAAHETGTATLSFVVTADGRIAGAHLARSSGSATLDRETVAMASRIGQLPPPPNGRAAISVPIHYSFR
jgi:periplasmic protein TonB